MRNFSIIGGLSAASSSPPWEMATDACLRAVQKLPPSLQHKIGALLGVAGEACAAEREDGALVPTGSTAETASGSRALSSCPGALSEGSEPAAEPLHLCSGVLVLDSFLAPAEVLVRHRPLPVQGRVAYGCAGRQRARALKRVQCSLGLAEEACSVGTPPCSPSHCLC